jgi:3-oxoacyl-[acyl-carrier protein] reductase
VNVLDYGLSGRVALVTGAGRGLGRAFAETLAREGCSIAMHGRREHGPAEYGDGTTLTAAADEVASRFGVPTSALLGDLTDAAAVARIVEQVERDLGPIEILVHNAGGDIGASGGKPDPNDALRIAEADIRAVLDRNVLTTILLCQAVAQRMVARRRGRIVTVSSTAAFRGRTHGAIYATAKAAVVHYTRCLADQLREHEITVNTLAPGDTRTGRFLGTRAVDAQRMVESGTLDRIGLVDEVADALLAFVGPAGRFVSGQVLRIDGAAQLSPA